MITIEEAQKNYETQYEDPCLEQEENYKYDYIDRLTEKIVNAGWMFKVTFKTCVKRTRIQKVFVG